eukprot:scaffold197112_cov34-Tisochrysis_lutea.AAC.1
MAASASRNPAIPFANQASASAPSESCPRYMYLPAPPDGDSSTERLSACFASSASPHASAASASASSAASEPLSRATAARQASSARCGSS